ncbi:MAG: hypothetical protein ACOVNY_09925 [Chitinophagaceae bacterium]
MCKYFFLLFIGFQQLVAQPLLTKNNQKLIRQYEASIQTAGIQMIQENEWFDRFRADSFFTRGLVQALRVPHSFEYAFDSLKTISKIYAPDSSFRIFSWQVMKDFTYYRQRGAIQMKTADGSLKLFPLIDVSDFTKAPNDSIRETKRWIGAIYYKILLNMAGNKKVYTLLGFDDNEARSNKKWIEILTFNQDGIPELGGRYFQYTNDSIKPKQPAYRFNVEYKKDAKVRMNYDVEAEMIVFDHLISETNDIQNKYTLIPDGTYEAFKWINGRWTHIPKLANLELGNGNAPLENPIFDAKGNIDQKKIDEQSKKNKKQSGVETENPYKLNDKKKKVTKPEEKVDY